MSDKEVEKLAEIKPSFDENRQKLGKILPLNTPFNIQIDSSEACNFKCEYCFRAKQDKAAWGYAAHGGLMEWDLFTKIVDQIMEFPEQVRQISLSVHGEPLCNRNVPRMAQYIKAKGITSRISLHTNASLLDEKYARELATSGVDRIVVSLQGMTAQKYKDTCGVQIDYDQFYHNLEILSRTKKQMHVKVVDAALDAGEEELFYEKYRPIAERVYVEKVVPIWKDAGKNAGDADFSGNKYGSKFPKQHCCPVLFHTMVVTPQGDVYPCTQLLFPQPLGNVKANTLVNLWNSEERLRMLQEQLEGREMAACHGCYIKENSIFMEEDLIDPYSEEVLDRVLQKNSKNSNKNDSEGLSFPKPLRYT